MLKLTWKTWLAVWLGVQFVTLGVFQSHLFSSFLGLLVIKQIARQTTEFFVALSHEFVHFLNFLNVRLFVVNHVRPGD